MNILTGTQIKEADRFTMETEPIASLDLMERASGAVADWFKAHIGPNRPLLFLIGKGNRMLSDAHKYATANESLVKRSTRCGCFNCMDTYPPEEILDWIDDKDGRTAVCPHCFVDAVLPDSCPYSISPYFLRRMNRKWL